MSNIWLLASLLPIAIAIVFVGYFFISTIDLFSSIDISTPYYNYNEFNLVDRTVCIIIGFMGIINFGVSIGFICMLINRRHSHFKRQKVFAKDTVATITDDGYLTMVTPVTTTIAVTSRHTNCPDEIDIRALTVQLMGENIKV